MNAATGAAVGRTVVGRPLLYGVQRRTIARELAAEHGGVVNRRTLARHGIDRHGIRHEMEAGRWFRAGRHTVAVTGPDLGPEALLWRAVWESGSGARLDGTSALIADGLTGFSHALIDVSLAADNRHHPVEDVRLHRVAVPSPNVRAGIPRVAAEVATIHAAQWAVSDRQAALLICLPVQQRLTSPARLGLAWRGVSRSPRRAFLGAVIGLRLTPHEFLAQVRQLYDVLARNKIR